MSQYKINALVDFSNNLALTIQDVKKQLRQLANTSINIPINIGNGRGGGGAARNATDSYFDNLEKSVRKFERRMKGLNLGDGLVKVNTQAKHLQKTINDVDGELQKIGFQAALTTKRFAAFVGVSAIFVGINNAMTQAVSSAVKYETQMAKISQVTGTSMKNLGELDREITSLSKNLGVSSESISEVALTLAQAGLTAQDTTKALSVLAKTELSATFDDIKDTTEGAIAIMAQFGSSVNDLEKQLAAVNTISARFAVESGDLIEVVRKSGGAFRAAGGELNELFALFTSVRSTTRESAESIATGLRTIITRLQRNKTVNFLSDLGIDLRDAKGEFIGVYPAIEKLNMALRDVSTTDPRFNQIVEELGGFRQVSKVIPLLKQFEQAQKALSVAKRSGASLDRDVAISQQTLANQFARVREEFNAMVRAYMNDGSIRQMLNLALNLASAFIKVADAVRPLAPLFAAFGSLAALKGLGQIYKGAAQQAQGPLQFTQRFKEKHFSTGGPVPGSGNGDTVPAMLEPGEFVLNKRSVKNIGMSNLHRVNKYAGGGLVGRMFSGLRNFGHRGAQWVGNTYVGQSWQKSRQQGLGLSIPSINDEIESLRNARTFGQDLSHYKKIAKHAGWFRALESSLGITRENRWSGFGPNDAKNLASNIGSSILSTTKSVGKSVGGSLNSLYQNVKGLATYADGNWNQYTGATTIGYPMSTDSNGRTYYVRKLPSANYKSIKRIVSGPKGAIPGQVRTDENAQNLKQVQSYYQWLRGHEKKLGVKFNIPAIHIADEHHPNYGKHLGPNPQLNGALPGGGFVRADNLLLVSKKMSESEYGSRQLLAHEFGHALDFKKGNFQSLQQKTIANKLAISYVDALKRSDAKNNPVINTTLDYRYKKKEAIAKLIQAYLNGDKNTIDGIPIKNYRSQIEKFIRVSSKRKKMATGGAVCGTGNTDTVNSLLTPGEFVINKKSAQAIGYNNLHKMNRYAKGGMVNPGMLAFGLATAPQLLSQGLTPQSDADIKEGKTSIQSLLNGLSSAGAALLIFSNSLTKDTTALQEQTATIKAQIEGKQLESLENQRRKSEQFDNLVAPQMDSIESIKAKRDAEMAERQARADELANKKGALFTPQNMQRIPIPGGYNTQLTPEAQKQYDALEKKEKKLQDDTAKQMDKYTKSLQRHYDAVAAATAKFDTEKAAIVQNEKIATDKLQAELKVKEAALKADEAFNVLSSRLQLVATGAIALGVGLTDANMKLAGAGKTGGVFGLGTKNESAVGGLLSGGGGGLSLGVLLSGFAPKYGKAITAGLGVAGAAVGAYTGYNSASSGLSNFDTRKQVDQVENLLRKLGSGRTTIKDSKAEINTSLDNIEKLFFSLKGADFDTFRGGMENASEGFVQIFNESIKSATSLDKFIAENEKLINVLVRFGGYTMDELEKKIKAEIDAREKSKKVTDTFTSAIQQNGRRLHGIMAIESSVAKAELDTHRSTVFTNDSAQLASGNIGSGKANLNFSTLSNPSLFSQKDFSYQMMRMQKIFGDGEHVQRLGKEAIEAHDISSKLPSILNEGVFRNQLQGEDLIDFIKEKIGKGFGSNAVLDAIANEIGNTGDTTKFIEKFKLNPTQIIKNIQAGIDPISKAFADAVPAINREMDAFADGLAQARHNAMAIIEGEQQSVNIQRVGAQFYARAAGEPMDFEVTRHLDQLEASKLIGSMALSPATPVQQAMSLGQDLRDAQDSFQMTNVSGNTQDIRRFLERKNEDAGEIEKNTKALQYLADINARLSSVEEERSRLESIRSSKTDLAKGFVFGDAAQKGNIIKSIVGVKSIMQNLEAGKNPLAGMSDELKQGALGLLEQFKDAKVFNGQTGQQIIDKVLKESGVGVEKSKEEKDAEKLGQEIIAGAQKAQEILNQNLRDTNKDFISDLRGQFIEFFDKLERHFEQDQKNAAKNANEEIDARQAGIDKKVAAINKIQEVTGVDVDGEVNRIESNIPAALEIKKNREAIEKAKEEKTNLFRGVFGDDIVDTKGIERLLPASNERDKLIKDIEDIKSNNKLSVEEKNIRIKKLAEPVIDRYIKSNQESNTNLLDSIGIHEDLVEGFIDGATEAAKIIKEAEISGQTTKGLQTQRNELDTQRLASGGPVFAARGSDTVPAMTPNGRPFMLTPGEFVMNRRAVKKYGPVLQQMNAGYLASGGSVGGPAINPSIMSDFNNVLDKIAGTKLELHINGSLNVNINSGNLSDKVKEGFREAVEVYVDEQIDKAIRGLIKDAKLPIVRNPGKIERK